jgi:phosphonate transport system substrate-binding protein
MRRSPVPLLVALILAAAIAGCDRGPADGARTGAASTAERLVLVVSPSHAEGAPADATERLATALTDALEVPVVVSVPQTREAAIAAFAGEGVHIGLLPVFDYMLCRAEYGVRAVLRVLRRGGADAYSGEIVVRTDSGIDSLADLDGKLVAFVDDHSVGGFVLPLSLLDEQGVDVDGILVGSHGRALDTLRTGQVAGAATYAGAAADDPSLRSLARTESVANEPVFVSGDVPDALARRIADAFVAAAATPTGRQALGQLGDIESFRPVTDDDYRDVARLLRHAGRRLQDVVPGGWHIYNENRHSLAREFGP